MGTLLLASLLLNVSCVPLALGAAGGYILSEDGYRIQPPVTRE